MNKVIILIIFIFFNIVSSRLNKPIDYTKKHIIGWSSSNNLEFYNSDSIKWNSIDSLCIRSGLSNAYNIIKIAQSNNINGIINVESNSFNTSTIQNIVQIVQSLDADGISIWFYKVSPDLDYYAKINALGTALKNISPNYLVTVQIPIRNTPYNFVDISQLSSVDYVIAYSYDMGTFVGTVGSNSPTTLIRTLTQNWLNSNGINKNKIILSIPWYAYMYKCDSFPYGLFTTGCVASESPSAISFYEAYQYLSGQNIGDSLYISTDVWQTSTQNPLINIRKLSGANYSNPGSFTYYQIQYDNPQSNYMKIQNSGVNGIGIYYLDTLYGLNQNIINSMYASINRDFI